MRANLKPLLALAAAGVVFAAIAAVVWPSPEQPPRRELQGNLYFASGSHLGRFDLRDGSSSVVGSVGDVNIRRVSALDQGRVLLSVTGPVNDRLVSRILQYDLETGEKRALFQGRYAHYVPGAGHIVFDRGSGLFSTGMRSNEYTETLIHARSGGVRARVLALSGDNILYATLDTPDAPIRKRNLVTMRDVPLARLAGLCRLKTALWISDRQRLLCPIAGSAGARFRFVTLDGDIGDEFALPDLGAPHALAYLTGQHAVIFTNVERRLLGGKQKVSVWVYDLQARDSWRLSGNQFLGTSVAYQY